MKFQSRISHFLFMSHPNKWLIAYNSISASLWTIVLFNTIFLGASLGQPLLFDKTNKITTAIQTLAVVEIYNSLVGNVKSPLFTTTTQVFSRLLIVWGICQALPPIGVTLPCRCLGPSPKSFVTRTTLPTWRVPFLNG